MEIGAQEAWTMEDGYAGWTTERGVEHQVGREGDQARGGFVYLCVIFILGCAFGSSRTPSDISGSDCMKGAILREQGSDNYRSKYGD